MSDLQQRISMLARNLEHAREDEETTAVEIRAMERSFLKLVAERDRRVAKGKLAMNSPRNRP